MLTVRNDQMAALAEDVLRAFEDRTYGHLLRYFPHHCDLLGEVQVRRVILHGWRRAKRHGLEAECCVRSYIDLMFVLGGGFDNDALMSWAKEILSDQTPMSQVERGDLLYEAAWSYIRRIARDYRDENGQPTTARFVGELRQFRTMQDRELTPSERQESQASLFQRIERLFPAKCAYVGEAVVRQVIARSIEDAVQRHALTTERGIMLFVMMRFILGAELDDDPLLPWVASTLRDQTQLEPGDRVDKLFLAAVSFLRRWWEAPSPLDLNLQEQSD